MDDVDAVAPSVAAARARLGELPDTDLHERVAVLDEVQRRLQASLTDLDES